LIGRDDSEVLVEVNHSTHCPYQSGAPLDGIVAFLTRKCGANPARSGLVKVTQSSYHSGRFAENVCDLMAGTAAVTDEEQSGLQWILIDFQRMSVVPTYYTIRSYEAPVNWAHLKSWRLEGQEEDGQVWKPLHECVNTGVLNGPYATATFVISLPMKCRRLRILTTGPTHIHYSRRSLFGPCPNWPFHYVAISAFEIFGELIEP
jgi:hypothetical protein